MKVRGTSIVAAAVVAVVVAGVISLSMVNAARFDGTFESEDLTYWYEYANKNSHMNRDVGTRGQDERSENQQQRALEEIQAAEEAIALAEELIDSLQCDPPNNVTVLLEEAKEHFTKAEEALEDEKYGRAYGLANSAKKLAQNAIKNLEDAELDEENEADNEEIGPEPSVPDDEPNMITIWYLLASPYEVDPYIHTYILNTSDETLYDVDFKQFIPSDLQLADDFWGWAEVRRYNEEMVKGTDSGTESGTYLTPSTYSYTYKDGSTCTTTRTVSGNSVTVTTTYTIDGQTDTYTCSEPATQKWSTSYRAIWSGPTENRIYDGGYSDTFLNMTGREGTAHIAETWVDTYRQSSEPNKLEVAYSYEYTYVNDYLQRFYEYDWYSYSLSNGTNLSVDYLGPMDMIYSIIRVIPAGTINPNRIYSVATRVEGTAENGKCYAISDRATWQEPFSIFKGIGAPYLGTMTLEYWEFSNYRTMYSYPVMGGYVADERIELIGNVDLWAPDAFNLSAPADGAWVSNNTPELSWCPASDRGFGINNYKLYVDNSLDKVITDNTRTSENVSELAAGAHTWYVVAVDHAGNERRSTSTWTINIENSAPISDNNLIDNLIVDNTLTEENALVQDNIATENSVEDNITTVDNLTADNTLVQGTTDNSTTTDDTTTTQGNASDNSITTDNLVVQENTTDTSSTSSGTITQDNGATNNSSTTNNTTVQDSITTSDTTVSDSSTSSAATQDNTNSSSTSDATVTQDNTTESSTDTTTDTTSSSDTSESGTATESTSSTSSEIDGETTPTTEETTDNTAPGNSTWGHLHKESKGDG